MSNAILTLAVMAVINLIIYARAFDNNEIKLKKYSLKVTISSLVTILMLGVLGI